VDLNVDIGEGFPFDEQLLEFATSANVCCGEHAGSWELTAHTIEMCKRKGVRIGMHPGFPDRKRFGRFQPEQKMGNDWVSSLEEQMRRFMTLHKAVYVKPHGGWYNLLCSRLGLGEGKFYAKYSIPLANAVKEYRIQMMLLPVAHVTAVGKKWLIREGFADRAYQADGTLKPRTEPGAVLEDAEEIKEQVLRLAPEVDSICLHGDTPGCLEFAEMVRKTLEDAGYEVAA
jgi:5-oxoprolinase (ATP-hydrolysing) subunit A